MTYFPTHSHSEMSWLDGMGSVQQMAQRVAKMNQPALALTDHGHIGGAIRLYKECRKLDLLPYPGSEFYLVKDATDKDEREKRYHLGLLALNEEGYRALIRLSSRSHQRDRFHRKPLIDMVDLATMAAEGVTEGIALTTGCFFGLFQQTLVHQGLAAAKFVAERFAAWFPNTFVEVQHHNIYMDSHDDDQIVADSIKIADALGLPVIIGQDSHYCDKGHKPLQDLMKEICYFGDTDDAKFPGDSFHLASATWVKSHYTQPQWDRAMEGHQRLLDLHDLILPDLDTYKMRVPKVAALPDRELARLVDQAMAQMGGLGFDRYERRVKEELKVIATMGMSSYFLLVKDVTDWCASQGIIYNTRGSANGSLVCYYLGITTVDPIEWKTEFDRFLSLDRQKPPDIDLDVESTRRQDVIDYLRSKYPTMVQIGTYSKLGISHEIDEMTGEESDKGSLFVQYQAAARRKNGVAGDIPPEDLEKLYALADVPVRKSAGAHAAGFVLPGEGHPIDKHLATMLIASSNTTVTQAMMDDVEDAGYVKLDLLGLRSLATITGCLNEVGVSLADIPWDDRKTAAAMRSGKTAGVFQFEGWTTSKGAREMKVDSTADAIVCMALYRPALVLQRDRYLRNRAAQKITSLDPMIDHLLQDTYGVPVFQEQVLGIMKAAGLSFDEYNAVIKAVKASNDKVIAAQRVFKDTEPIFIRKAVKNGFTVSGAERAWRTVAEFTDYGFNRAHATSYGIMAYRSAYLKRHYPLEYMGSLLHTWAGTPKEQKYITEARRLKIAIVKPDINHSEFSWSIDRSRSRPTLRKGLLSIKGIGAGVAASIVEERMNNGVYNDMDEFVDRVPARPVSGGKGYLAGGITAMNGAMKTLAQADALRSVGIRATDMEEV